MQAVSVKIFSLMPTSMVDERAMSVATWINSPKRNRQDIATVSNHLAIRSNFMDFQNAVRTPFIYDSLKLTEYSIPPQRLLTVNWRDMKKTIFGKDDSDKSLVSTSSSTSGSESDPSSSTANSDSLSDSYLESESILPSEMVINESNG